MYFAGMFRIANVEFVPEYRQEESHEFVSMATKIQHVVSADVVGRRGGDADGALACRWLLSTGRPLWPDSTSRPSSPTSGTFPVHSSSKTCLHPSRPDSNNNKGGVLVHFWMVFVVPRLKSPAVCEECVGAIFRDSVHTSMKNRSSVGYLLGLPVDIDSILINGGATFLLQHLHQSRH